MWHFSPFTRVWQGRTRLPSAQVVQMYMGVQICKHIFRYVTHLSLTALYTLLDIVLMVAYFVNFYNSIYMYIDYSFIVTYIPENAKWYAYGIQYIDMKYKFGYFICTSNRSTSVAMQVLYLFCLFFKASETCLARTLYNSNNL